MCISLAGIAYAGTVLLVHIVQTWGAIRAARTLFRKTLARVVRAPSRWFVLVHRPAIPRQFFALTTLFQV